MKRLKSTLGTVLLVASGAAALGLGITMAVAAMVIGLVATGAARLLATAAPDRPIHDAEIIPPIPTV